MRHSIHIMFGKNFSQIAQDVMKHILKCGERQHSEYFKSILWFVDNNNNVVLSTIDMSVEDHDSFMTGLENTYQLKISESAFSSNNKEDLIRFFTFLHQNSINLDNQSFRSQLHYCLYFPLYDQEAWDNVKECISILNSLQLPLEIDLFGFSYDLADLINVDIETKDLKSFQKNTVEVIRDVLEVKKKPGSNITHFIIMQNYQSSGISLNLSLATLVKIISEFAIICVECYNELFPSVQSNSGLHALGLSVLSLDKYYYVEYLLHKAYIFALEREGINGIDKIEDVDVVMATNTAQEILVSKINLLSEFYNNEIKTRLSNGISQDVIIQEITPILKNKMAYISTDIEAFIIDKKLSIPTKRAIFSALLGEDDELFDNQMFAENPLWLDDIDKEVFQVYIDANNALINTEKQKEEAVLSKDDHPVVSPLGEIRELRTEIIRTTSYIRKLEKEVDFLSKQVDNIEESKKSLTKDGFYEFGGINYQLLPKIEEKPLAEDYIPHDVKSAAIDLRSGFTRIKNQGKLGACTSFALTSVFEYILKSNKQEEFDLSEPFLYYFSRQKNGEEDDLTGTRIDHAIESLVEFGICIESKWPYKTGSEEEIYQFYTTEPSKEAKEDALIRRVKKAVNVKRTINDIKSSLEDGFPVVISTTLFDSFSNDPSGVISYPTEEEIKTAKNDNISRHHAMVICGYSEEDKLFIVRNSWGTVFGDNGYCYMPYSYITNDELTSYAAAIIEVTNFTAKGIVKRTSLPFGDDVRMRFAIKKNALEEEKRILDSLKNLYARLKMQYNELHELILNPHIQKDLTNSTFQRLTGEKGELQKKYDSSCNEMDDQLSRFDRSTKRKSISIALPIAIMALLEWLYCYFYEKGLNSGLWSADNGILSWLYDNKFLTITFLLALGLIVIGFFILIRNNKRKKLKEELQDICNENNRKVAEKENARKENKLLMHFAGMILSENSKIENNLTNKYQFMQSFYVNLNTWHSNERESLKTVNDQSRAPFISIINNITLDQYFETKKDEITTNISLCNVFIENYQLSEEGIRAFQVKLKQTFCDELLATLRNFTMYDFFTQPKEELFLDHKPPKKLLSELETKSNVFVRHSKSPNPGINIFIFTRNNDEKHNWQTISRPHFSGSPSQNSIISPLKLVMTQMEEFSVDELYI